MPAYDTYVSFEAYAKNDTVTLTSAIMPSRRRGHLWKNLLRSHIPIDLFILFYLFIYLIL